ncbi:hypothetical protein DPB93_25625 [Salmonella enterica subsp. salamae]|nr:hypothetical protein [Salmonella enterica subsp. salamae]
MKWIFFWSQKPVSYLFTPSRIVILAMSFEYNINTLKQFRKRKVQIPILLLNKSTDSNKKALALNSGADDCMDYPLILMRFWQEFMQL